MKKELVIKINTPGYSLEVDGGGKLFVSNFITDAAILKIQKTLFTNIKKN